MKTLQTLAAATILATSTAVSADMDMPFFGDNNNSNYNGSNNMNNTGNGAADGAADGEFESFW